MSDFVSFNLQLYLLVLARILALIFSAPLLSSRSIPVVAKLGLALFTAVAVAPGAESAWHFPMVPGEFWGLLLGEALLGLVMGFFLKMLFTAFTCAGHLLSIPIGLSGARIADPVSGEESTVMGQFFDLMAIFVFLYVSGFYRIFYIGISSSFNAFSAYDIVSGREHLASLLVHGLGNMFCQSLVLALPVLGIMLLVTVSMGILSRSVPEMNMLVNGFPLSLMIGFIMLFMAVPFLMEAFGKVLDSGFCVLEQWIDSAGGPV